MTVARRFSLALLALTVFGLSVIGPVTAARAEAGELKIMQGWAAPSMGKAPTGAAYLMITNEGAADRLIGAGTPVAERAELHAHIQTDGIMRMRRQEAVDIPADGHVAFAPGGLHIMLFGLKAPLKEGEGFPLTLIFEQAGRMEIPVDVRWPDNHQPGAHNAHGHHE